MYGLQCVSPMFPGRVSERRKPLREGKDNKEAVVWKRDGDSPAVSESPTAPPSLRLTQTPSFPGVP